MRRAGGVGAGVALALVAGLAVGLVMPGTPVLVSAVHAAGVGGASWTPSRSSTLMRAADHLVRGDAFLFETRAAWSGAQRDGLARYVESGLRYTHEVNDRSGRLSATGYWATNLPDPAFDRDDDDGDGRWEEAEITAGAQLPRADREYVARIAFSRWHGKQGRRACAWAWDLRKGSVEVFSQLSRDLLGEWQAERYTLTYDRLAYPRVRPRPALPDGTPRPECGPHRPIEGAAEVIVTFARPLEWAELIGLAGEGARWAAFEAIGSAGRDDLVWTCGGPVEDAAGTQACRDLGMRPTGVVAAGGAFGQAALDRLRASPDVAHVEARRDALTDLLGEVGGFGVEPPDLTLDDAYWRLFLDE